MKTAFRNVCYIFVLLTVVACPSNGGATLEKYDIKNDGITLTTEALQKAINDCAAGGGGIVSLPAGKYLTGTIILRNNVTLNLEKDAVILGSGNVADYPDKGRRKALVFAENVSNIALTGEGEINGNGSMFIQENNAPDRPTLIQFFDCKQVSVNGIKMTNSGFWTFRFVRCDGVDINKVYVQGHANWNNDGFDIESRNVTIANCILDTDDDAICFKSEYPNFVVENIMVTNCTLASNCNFIKFGTASDGGFRNIKVSNCTTTKCSKSIFRDWPEQVPGVTDEITGIAGIALEVVDGGFMENITISDITMQDVQTPIFIRLSKRKISDNSYLKDILIENIIAQSVSYVASSITGVPGLRVENVEIRNVDFKLKAGGQAADTQVEVPEVENQYPENRMFGVMLPAYGFYIRHAKNIVLDNVNLSFLGGKEERHAIVADDVNGLTIRNSTLQQPDGGTSLYNFKNSQDINAPE
jgi:polygalacturonase